MLYITNIPSPYRVDFFNELNKYCDLTVLFERRTANDRDNKWYNNIFKFEGVFLRSKGIGNEASISFEVVNYLKKDYDIIILGGYSSPTSMIAILYMKLHKISYVLNADGGFINYREKKFNKFIKTFFISSAKFWLSSGKETNKYLVYYGAKEDRIFNYSFTSLKKTDILKFPVTKEEKNFLKNNFNIPYEKVILAVGQFIPRKGFDWMIESYKSLSHNIGIYIIGGKPTDEYIKLKEKYGMDNLHFIDFQDKYSIKKWYQLADLFILPTREDIWGLVVNEAMAQGLPVITTDRCIAGLELIKDKEIGYIVKCENIKDLLNATNECINNSDINYLDISRKIINSVSDITIERMAKQHHNILSNIINVKVKEKNSE